MHMMQLLEDKVIALLELVESLKKENGCLKKEALTAGQEIAQLKKQVEMLESSVLNESHRLQELHKEKELTKTVVDDLIRNIEALVESGNQSQ